MAQAEAEEAEEPALALPEDKAVTAEQTREPEL